MQRLALISAIAAAACGGKPKTPPTVPVTVLETTEEATVATKGVLDEPGRLAAWSTEFDASLRATGAQGAGGASVVIQRQSIDTGVVVSLVRERLAQVAVRAAADLLRGLKLDADRPWARDLLDVVARVAVAQDENRRVVAETAVRILARQVVGSALVRTRLRGAWTAAEFPEAIRPSADPDKMQRAAIATIVVDFAYWRMAKLDFLADEVAIPPCTDTLDVCTKLTALATSDEAKAIDAIDTLLHLDAVLDGIKLVARLRALQADRPLSAALIIEQLVRYEGLGKLDDIAAGWAALTPDLTELLKQSTAIAGRVVRLNAAIQIILVPDQDAAKIVKAATEAAAAIGTDLGPVLDRMLGGVAADAIATAAKALETLKTTPADATALAIMKTQAEILKTFYVNAGITDVQALSHNLSDLVALIKAMTQTAGTLPLDRVPELLRLARDTVLKFQRVVDALGRIDPDRMARLRDAIQQLKGIAGILEKTGDLAALLGNADLTSVMATVKSLGFVDANGDVVLPVIELLEPALDSIAAGRRLTVDDFYIALGRVRPTELARALGLSVDFDQECKHRGTWRCWSSRLAMLVHGALRLDDGVLTIDTGQVVKQVADAATASQRNEPCHWFLHAAIGTGLVNYDAERWSPLIAEQIGLGINVGGNSTAYVRLAAYGSGLLYRYVLDSRESDGVMFGGALLVDLYQLVELYGATGVTIVSGNDGPDDAADAYWMTAVGIQVPLGDYLSRITE